MKLGFVSGRMSSIVDGRRAAHSGLSRLVHALRDRVESLVVGTSDARVPQKEHDTELGVQEHQYVALPWQTSAAAGLTQGGASRRAIARVERRCDVLCMQLPFSPPWALEARTVPRVYHVCGDVPEVVRASKYYTGLKRIAAVGFAEVTQAWTRSLTHESHVRTVTNGRALHERLARPAGRAIVSSSLRRDEVGTFTRKRAASAPVRIAFCGYLRPEKGLDVLIEAYARLLRTIPDAELVIIGAQDLGEGGAVTELERVLGGRGHVLLRGLLPFGPTLFQELADADVLALPSRSEGTPRVLVEARAFGCPVVASRVGGIPTSVDDGVDGLLVEPDDAEALAASILRVVTDPGLRRALIEHGFARAHRSTVEALAEAIIDEAESLLQDPRNGRIS